MITRTEIERLMTFSGARHLSIYLPTEKVGAETQQNPIRLKNLIDQTENSLREKGMQTGEINDFLEPVVGLLNNAEYWKHQDRSLAIFRSPEVFFTYQLPITVKEVVYLNTRFFIKPLIPLLDDADYYVLALSLNHVRLFSASRFSIQDLTNDQIPTNMEETLGYDAQNQLQFHTKAQPGRGGERSAMFFGTGSAGEEQKKDDILRYFQILNKAIYAEIAESSAPMILFGVEYLLPIYRDANSYPHLTEMTVTASPEGLSLADIHKQTLPLVETFFNQDRQAAIESYHILANQHQASKDIREIIPAAFFGQVESLLVSPEYMIWGQFDPERMKVTTTSQRPRHEDEDLVDLAIANTLKNRGSVFACDPVEMPDGARIAAILRYPLDGIDYKTIS